MQIDLHSDGLSIQFEAEQARHYLNYYWLRDNCPESFDPQTRERVFDISELPQAPKARSAVFSTTDEPQLVIHWQHEDHISHYDLAWLQARCTAGKRPDPAAIPRKLWYGDHYQHFQRFHFHALKDAPAEQLRWAKSLLEEGVAIIDQMPDSDAGLTTLANLLGCIRPSVAGDYFEVKVHAVPVNLSYTAAALEMHTDTPAEEMAPGIQFLHCRVNTATGGESLFLDGVAAATTFREQYPEDFRLLSEKRIPFYYDHEDFDWRAYQRVIELDDHGEISGVTVSQHMADAFDLPQEELDDYYPAFVRFLKLLKDPRFLATFRLNAGECIVFDNHRIVHGRASYDPSSGDRHLRGCYIDRGELRSRYRTLLRQSESR
ncbi:TauD/TfdA family dioxygenase [Aliamphritea spongicola]|uniref:TauD/TfdA family dioxygenase n=1 Tax=Aliamphritea spongicola TaxID=707589 RepID=UPI00196A97A7|nr:TauD/TfdA family dioxygenase [Aliamphritea spongicola]MBN3561998.1 TauD/TfdA family dioxygenase [Aliamphritea spongicola]